MKKILILIVYVFFVLTSAVYGQELPTKLDDPTGLVVEQKHYEDGSAYFILRFNISENVVSLTNNNSCMVLYQVDYMSSGNWKSESIDADVYLPTSALISSEELIETIFDPANNFLIGDINTSDLSFRVRLVCSSWTDDGETKDIFSAFSNVVSFGTVSADTMPSGQEDFYRNASSWAVEELNKAVEYGFITDKIKEDMKAPITREEFCEVVVGLYEKLTGTTATYDSNPFNDTTNQEILKAYELGIVKGIGEGKFAPNNLITRQEISVMLSRVVKVCNMEADFSTSGVGKFKDEEEIAPWAIDAVRFMFNKGIVKGIGDGSIDPKGNTTREEAVLLVVRTFEKYMNGSK